MFGLSNLPQVGSAKIEIFYGTSPQASSGSTSTGWIPWTRPKNATWIYMLAVGGGGGGGAGYSGTVGAARFGATGGGTGAMVRTLIPAFALPRTMYLYPGRGGAGGVAAAAGAGLGTAGISASITMISTRPNVANQKADAILISCSGQGNTGATGGAAATLTGQGTAGSAEAVATSNYGGFFGLGVFASVTGLNGVAANATWGASGLPASGGAGGGSVDASEGMTAGGDVSAAAIYPLISGGAAGAGGGSPGKPGVHLEAPWMNSGGAGGGSSSGGIAGAGGNGARGCGGGGGGGGLTGGNGGDGGSGYIIIMSF